MKLWLVELIQSITQQCNRDPARLNISLDPRHVREAIIWLNDDGSLFAKYYCTLRKLKTYSSDATHETLFYDSGQIAQITQTAPGMMTTECFDRDGNPVDFADFNELRT